jgi:hypothetical protein
MTSERETQDRVVLDARGGEMGRDEIGSETQRTGPPWESLEEAGTVRGLLETLYGSMFGPVRFFNHMRCRGGYLSPLVYAVILGSFAILVSIGWECLFISLGDRFLDAGSSEQLGGLRSVSYGLTAILSPVMIAVLVFVSSGVFHLVLLAMGGAARGFQTSFRVVCYSQGTAVWNIVPFFGAAIGGIWNLVLVVIGLTESHGTSAWKAAAAVFIPVIASSILVIAIVLMISDLGSL